MAGETSPAMTTVRPSLWSGRIREGRRHRHLADCWDLPEAQDARHRLAVRDGHALTPVRGGTVMPPRMLRQLTLRVSAAVWSFPPVWNCRNIRQLPGLGSMAWNDRSGPP